MKIHPNYLEVRDVSLALDISALPAYQICDLFLMVLGEIDDDDCLKIRDNIITYCKDKIHDEAEKP